MVREKGPGFPRLPEPRPDIASLFGSFSMHLFTASASAVPAPSPRLHGNSLYLLAFAMCFLERASLLYSSISSAARGSSWVLGPVPPPFQL